MSGFQEILLIAVIFLILFIIPRMTSPERSKSASPRRIRRIVSLPGSLRLAIVMSIIWLAGSAAWAKPWHGSLIPYLYLGPGPVAVAWAVAWIIQGYKRFRS